MFSFRPPIRSVLRNLILLPGLIVPLAATGFAQTIVQARQADQFVDSMGVNVHMESSSLPYSNYTLINEKLGDLGLRHFRDEINDTESSFVEEIKRIGALGYSLCGLIEGGNDYPPAGTRLDPSAVAMMIHNLRPTIEAVEGPNEPDNASFVYGPNARPYPQGAIEESVDLWNIVREHPEISDLPVLGMSEGSAQDFAQLADATHHQPVNFVTFGNMHAYQGGFVGDSGLAHLYIPDAQAWIGSKPLWTTEMGYHNHTGYLSDGEQQGVSQRASAIYLPIAFLSGFSQGVLRTFSYELIDEPDACSAGVPSGECQYGLLNRDFTPKPAFTAVKNLVAILSERGAPDFQPGSLEVTFSGAPQTLRYTLLQKSSGAYYLALWNDVRVYRTARLNNDGTVLPGKDLYPPNVPITVTFSTAKNFTIYSPNDATGSLPTDAYTLSKTPRSIDVALSPHLLLIRIVAENAAAKND